jgi:hypothetical protein
MRDSSPALRARLATLGVLSPHGVASPPGGLSPHGIPSPRPWIDVDRGPAFEVRKTTRSVREVFGREAPHPADAGALFLDTETTGLAGGTGTTPFLIGLASVDGGTVTVEQFFLRRLSGEAAMLEELRDRLDEAETLVTFNGRRFDWPILEARFIISRMPCGAPGAHMDLMTLARRLWYRPLGTYRLTAIERAALGIERADDVDSSLIPSMYLEFLRTGDTGPLQPVFEHNRHDVLCLLHLRRRMRRWIDHGEDPPSPIDWEGLGVLRLAAGDEARALESWRRALRVEGDPKARWRIAGRLARVLRRAARWDDVLQIWEREVGGRGAWRVKALIEAAKIYQRRLGDTPKAIAALQDAAGVLEWLLVRDDPMAPALDEQVSERLSRLRTRPRRRPRPLARDRA